MTDSPVNRILFFSLSLFFAIGCSALDTTTPSAPEALPEFSFPAAVTIVGPQSRIKINGSALMASGGRQLGGIGPHYGTQLDGKLDVHCSGKSGIATESVGPAKAKYCDTATCVQYSNSGERLITGAGGQTPSIAHGQTQFTLTTAQKLWHRLTQTSKPIRKWDEQKDVPLTKPFGSLESPAILHYKDEATISNLAGTGILIVDGDLNIRESLKWRGIILVGVCDVCEGILTGKGELKLYGTLVAKKTLDVSNSFIGTARISYSCQAIEKALTAISKLGS
jgi:hypothetical protein